MLGVVAVYDYIMAGSGAAGLSLAYQLVQAGLGDKKILLLDREPKTDHDRTWCFWESGVGPFEELVFRSWDHLWFHGPQFSRRLEIAPYRYKMIRGGDFYRFLQDWVGKQPNLEVAYGEITQLEDTPQGGVVHLGSSTHQAQYVFSSLYTPAAESRKYRSLLQHFKGWVVHTPQAVFDTGAATFMDFRIQQHNRVEFVYVLPFDSQTALVEYTLFSPNLLTQEEYDQGLRSYLQDYLQLQDYQVSEEEFGIIPRTDAPMAASSQHIVPIGTAGGRTKASTGYTFQRIQQHSRQIAAVLAQGGSPQQARPQSGRFDWYDSVLLEVLSQPSYPGHQVFCDLFSKNAAHQVLHFLEERTSFPQEVALMSSVNIPVFAAAMLRVLARRLGR